MVNFSTHCYLWDDCIPQSWAEILMSKHYHRFQMFVSLFLGCGGFSRLNKSSVISSYLAWWPLARPPAGVHFQIAVRAETGSYTRTSGRRLPLCPRTPSPGSSGPSGDASGRAGLETASADGASLLCWWASSCRVPMTACTRPVRPRRGPDNDLWRSRAALASRSHSWGRAEAGIGGQTGRVWQAWWDHQRCSASCRPGSEVREHSCILWNSSGRRGAHRGTGLDRRAGGHKPGRWKRRGSPREASRRSAWRPGGLFGSGWCSSPTALAGCWVSSRTWSQGA